MRVMMALLVGLGTGHGCLNLRQHAQHDRQCVSVNVFLWEPLLALLLSVFPRARRVPRGSKPLWLRLVFYLELVGVDCFGSV